MRKILLYLLLITFLSALSLKSASAIDPADCEKDEIPKDKASECIDYLSKKIDELGTQKRTLGSQITQFNTQIQLTQVKITDAQATIDKLEEEISALGFRIDYVNDSVTKLEKLLKQRIIATYEQGTVSNLELLLASHDFSDLVLRIQYLRQVQENDKRILANLQQTKANYANQKDERETKQAQIEASKKKLEQLSVDLEQQKAEKQALLKLTQNSENRYQQLLAIALAEKQAISAAFSDAITRLNNGEGESVSQGQTIAVIGNSGAPNCSSGPHLHFTVLKDGAAQNPAEYLRDVSPAWDNSPDSSFSFSGSWDWPIAGPRITQGFGMTYWAKLGWYGGGIHDGIDMVGGPSIVAPRAGKMIVGSTFCGSSALKYAAIKHNDDAGIITLYLHIQ